MTKINIRVIESNGDVALYPEADSISIDGDVIDISWDDGRAEHLMVDAKEIVVKPEPTR